MNPRILLVSIIALALLTGCPDDGDEPQGPASPSEFLSQWDVVWLQRYRACIPFQSVRNNFIPTYEKYDQSLAAGRLAFDKDKALQCLDSLRSRSCESLLWGGYKPESCYEAIEGRVSPGGACYLDFDCAAGRCDMTTSCPGACVAFAVENEPCTGARCEDRRLYCGEDDLCHRRIARGEACTGADECVEGLQCRDGVCADWQPHLASEGKICGLCATGLYCDYPVDRFAGFPSSKNGTCKPLPAPAAGDACDLDSGCGDLACAGWSGTTAGRCSEWADVGEPCTEMPGEYGVSGCKVFLACIDGRCQEPPTSGPCYSGGDISPACNDATSFCSDGQCTPLKAPGEACSNMNECAGYTCTEGVCQAPGGCAP